MSFNSFGYNEAASMLMEQTAKATEASILEQLNDFISRGLIEVQTTNLQLVQSADYGKIEIRHAVKLVLKDKEYIEQLEAKVKKYEDIFAALKAGE
jgi:hypothetical protein